MYIYIAFAHTGARQAHAPNTQQRHSPSALLLYYPLYSSHQLVLAQVLRLEGLALPLRVARRVTQAAVDVVHAQQRHGVRSTDRQQQVDEEAC